MEEPTIAEKTTDDFFSHLVESYQLPLRRMCCVWLRDRDLAEDAVQETFFKAWKGAPSFRGECSEKTWLMRIAVNVCRDMRRSAWHRHVDGRTPIDHLPEAAVPFQERDDTMIRALCRLPEKQREAVLLYFYQDMSLQEIGDALGRSPSAISRRIEGAKKALRRHLKGEEEND